MTEVTKIAIIGAPGSGKSDLANEIGPQLGGTWTLCDDYAERACDEVDYVPGFNGGYISHLAVALKRIGIERSSPDFHIVTCGTLLETSVYAAMDLEVQENYASELEYQTVIRRTEAVMKTLAVLFNDEFDYDYFFYLPNRQTDDKWVTFDKNLQAAWGAFFLVPVIPLLNNDLEQNAKDALSIIKKEISVEDYRERQRDTAAATE